MRSKSLEHFIRNHNNSIDKAVISMTVSANVRDVIKSDHYVKNSVNRVFEIVIWLEFAFNIISTLSFLVFKPFFELSTL